MQAGGVEAQAWAVEEVGGVGDPGLDRTGGGEEKIRQSAGDGGGFQLRVSGGSGGGPGAEEVGAGVEGQPHAAVAHPVLAAGGDLEAGDDLGVGVPIFDQGERAGPVGAVGDGDNGDEGGGVSARDHDPSFENEVGQGQAFEKIAGAEDPLPAGAFGDEVVAVDEDAIAVDEPAESAAVLAAGGVIVIEPHQPGLAIEEFDEAEVVGVGGEAGVAELVPVERIYRAEFRVPHRARVGRAHGVVVGGQSLGVGQPAAEGAGTEGGVWACGRGGRDGQQGQGGGDDAERKPVHGSLAKLMLLVCSQGQGTRTLTSPAAEKVGICWGLSSSP